MTSNSQLNPERASMFAHRALRKLARFSYDLTEAERALDDFSRPSTSKTIGLYRVPGVSGESIVFLSDGLVVVDGANRAYVPFQQIQSVALDDSEDKHLAEHILVVMADSTRHTIRVRGGTGKLRDVYDVYVFIRNVIRNEGARPERPT